MMVASIKTHSALHGCRDANPFFIPLHERSMFSMIQSPVRIDRVTGFDRYKSFHRYTKRIYLLRRRTQMRKSDEELMSC
ncbi:hypothetical protein J2S30_004555 [Herbaspirillum rubrisubalbicans]|uniref:hypothetical protein n=1 Tax=Herbaspirillum rubrisubalbicans TaxID=80842 RepID=UPI001ED9A615|nr:hypothetical protein [Herbaspirillum rubrisubalbicans]MCP1576176.1 hypothetical protein [Herbaspirillum rubrisubalbicans]